jgi:putative membrane protein
MWGYDGGWGWWGWMGLAHGVLWWAFLILGIVLLVRWISRSDARTAAAPPAETALDILKKRYAKGEIGREEFEQKKLDLQS